ncbi:MAG: hydrogenase formation protein HypD [candidate division WOR-3 bacterium]
MRVDDEFGRRLLGGVNDLVERVCSSREVVTFMEVCGTHTMAVSYFGIRRGVDSRLRLLSGPGCPVCVTGSAEIDAAVAIARLKGVTVLTFGDMMRVPGSIGTLEKSRADGADVRVVYSALDCLRLAESDPRREFVFIGVGFETTAPTVAATVVQARKLRITNLSVLPMFKLIPPALRAVVKYREQLEKSRADVARLDGFLLPGHVSTIIGHEPYRFLAEDFGLPCVIAGFEASDVLQALLMLLAQLLAMEHGESAKVEVQYRRIVMPRGNRRARNLMRQVFEKTDSNWRGLGLIPNSGLGFRSEFRSFDARRRFDIAREKTGLVTRTSAVRLSEACRCGEVMLGIITPTACELFGRICAPESPVGPCMVSSEGACAAYFRYERWFGMTDRRN